MTVLEKIEQRLQDRGWSIYRLAQEAGISYNTLSNLWRRGNEPKLETLEAICRGFGISMVEFFKEADDEVSVLDADQKELLAHWSTLSYEQKEALLTFLRGFDGVKPNTEGSGDEA